MINTNCIKHIAFITSDYPTIYAPHANAFVAQLVETIADEAIVCTIISPLKLHKKIFELITHQYNDSQTKLLHRPCYITISNFNLIIFNTWKISEWTFSLAVGRAIRRVMRQDNQPDAFYGHFLYPSGRNAIKYGKLFGKPSFVAMGESSLWSVNTVGIKQAIEDYRDVTGVIAVSSEIKTQLINVIGVPETKISVFPNGVDLGKFYPREKQEARRRLDLPSEIFIVAFVGHFNQRKGAQRVAKALNGLKNVGVIYVGNGQMEPTGENILFKGLLTHNKLAEILCAADIFVLPTLAEGSCNAILEAMACGLPVVSSIGTFNDEILNNDVSIRIDPQNIDEIRNAVVRLRDNPQLCNEMSINAIAWSKIFDIKARAKNILKWMEKMSNMRLEELKTIKENHCD